MAQQENGVKFFLWRTKEDDRVSTGYGGHKQLNGKIYAWNEPENYPIIDSYGHQGLPSQRVNCRCVASPVWVLDGWTAEKQSDGSYKIVRNLTRKNL